MAIIFSDDFSANGPIDASKWTYNKDIGGSAFLPPFSWMRQVLPQASGGVMRLELDTYNPDGNNALIGSEAVSQMLFNVADGPIAFEAKLKYEQTQPGIIGGFFTFAGPPATHDEIDFELMSNFFNQVQTNVYINEPLGEGHYKMHPPPAISNLSLGEFHTYRFEWYPTMVIWKVDGTVIRSENVSPTKSMALHFNIWANDDPRVDGGIRPTTNQAQGKKFYLDVDDVLVERIPEASPLSTAAANSARIISGTDQSEYFAGDHRDETMVGGGGDDVFEGGAGSDTVGYAGLARNFEISIRPGENIIHIKDRSGAEGSDAVHNVEYLQFADLLVDASSLVKASSVSASDFGSVINLYLGYLDRAPDALGLAYWASRLGDGLSLKDIAESFFTSAEANGIRPPGQTLTEMVSHAYSDVFDRAADVDGLSYWVGQLQTGQLQVEHFALVFVQGAHAGGHDAEILENKQHLGAHYALEHGLTDVAHAAAVMDAFDGQSHGGTLADFSSAFALVENYAAAAALPDNGELVVKLVGVGIGD